MSAPKRLLFCPVLFLRNAVLQGPPIGVLLVCAVLLFASACKPKAQLPQEKLPVKSDHTAPPASAVPQVPPAAAVEANLQNQVAPVIVGNVMTENQSTLAFSCAGAIDYIAVKPGDSVSKNQVLATLVSVQARLDVEASQIQVRQKQLAAELEHKKLARVKEQFAGGVVNQATLESARHSYESLVLAWEQAKNEYAVKKYNLSMMRLVAPYSGVISQKNKSVGDFVAPGTPVFEITQNTHLEIYAQIPSMYFEKVAPNALLPIRSATDKSQTGLMLVRKRIPVLDKTNRTFALYGTIKSFRGVLRPGDFVEITL